METTKKIDWKYFVKLGIGLVLMFGSQYIFPTWAEITPVGVAAIGIFLSILFLSTTGFGLIFPSILGMFAMQLTGYYDSASILTGSWGSTSIYQMITFFALSSAMMACGAADVIARWFITRKFTEGKPVLFTLMFMLGAVIVGALMDMGGMIFYYAILESICKQLNYEEDSKWNKLMVLGVNVCCCVGFTLLPFKGMPLFIFGTFSAAVSAMGISINFSAYLIASILLCIAFAAVYTVMLRYFWKIDMSKLATLDVSTLVEGGKLKMNRQQLIVSLGYAIAILYAIVSIFLPQGTAFTKWYSSITQPIWSGVVLGVLCVIYVDGKPVVNGEKVMKDGVSWSILISTGAFTLLGSMIAAPDPGVRGWLQAIMTSMIGNLPFPFFMLIVATITYVVTNFFSSVATGLIMMTLTAPIAVTYATAIGINPALVGFTIMASDMFAYLTLAASATSPIFLGHKAVEGDNHLIWVDGGICGVVFLLLNWVVSTGLAYIL